MTVENTRRASLLTLWGAAASSAALAMALSCGYPVPAFADEEPQEATEVAAADDGAAGSEGEDAQADASGEAEDAGASVDDGESSAVDAEQAPASKEGEADSGASASAEASSGATDKAKDKAKADSEEAADSADGDDEDADKKSKSKSAAEKAAAEAEKAAAIAAENAAADRFAAEVNGELSGVRGKIQETLDRIESLEADVKAAKARIREIEEDMQAVLDEISAEQAERSELLSSASDLIKELYKDRDSYNPVFILQESTTINGALRRLDMREKVLDRYNAIVEETKQVTAKLQEKYRKVSKSRDEQQTLVYETDEKIAKLQGSIEELRKQEKLLGVKEKAVLAEASARAQKVAETFETGTVGKEGDEGWKTGLASAYGGSSDDVTDPDALTASGTVCDDFSVGVAVPMAWGPEAYYGKYVEISYGGRSIVAKVVDCGEMNGGERALDLQPGVFKAFGCSTCDDWGVREVQYRYV